MIKGSLFYIKHQRGAALMVSLVILVLMTLIGLAAMRTSILEGKMAANTRDRELAFQAAEIALRDAERKILSNDIKNKGKSDIGKPEPSPTGSSGVWTMDGEIDPNKNNGQSWWEESARNQLWWTNNAITYSGTISNIKTSPMYIIEHHAFFSDEGVGLGNNTSNQGRDYYRITAKGTGGSNQSRVLVQGTYARRY